MKRIAMLSLVLMLFAAALAEGLGTPQGYLDAFGGVGWTSEADGRVMSLEVWDDAVVTLCARDGALLAVSVTAPRTERFEDLAEAALRDTGLVPARPLAAILADGAAQALDGARLVSLTGDLRRGLYLYSDTLRPGAELYWLPMHGGRRRHINPSCSGMDVPRLVSAEAADALGFDPCGRCMR